MTEQSRINAMIAYLFLGPLFLLVRSDTPIGEPYVRAHAKRASVIMGASILIIGLYIAFLKPFLSFQFFGISINSVILTSMMSILSAFLIHGSYRAYHGVEAGAMKQVAPHIGDMAVLDGNYSEEAKIRILASFVPFVGIFIAKRYPTEPYITGRKVGNLIAFILITLISFYGGAISGLVFMATWTSIILFAITGAYLFFRGEFLSLGVYKYIPTYTSIEAHIAASALSLWDFFRVAFGGTKTSTYRDIYTTKLALYSQTLPPKEPYILPTIIIGLPLINLITLPSLFIPRAHEYRSNILEGLALTLYLGVIIFFYSMSSPIALYLLFPALTLIAHRQENTAIRAPFTSWIPSIAGLFTRGQAKISEMGEKKEEVSFKYEGK